MTLGSTLRRLCPIIKTFSSEILVYWKSFKGRHISSNLEVIKTWNPECWYALFRQKPHEKKEKGIESTHQHQKTEVFPERDLYCFLPWLLSQGKTGWHSISCLLSLLSLLASCCFLLMEFPVSPPPFLTIPSLSPSLVSCSLSLLVCLCPSEGLLSPEAHRDWLAGLSGSCLVYGGGKLHRHISCLKLATGGAYLSRTEILVVRWWGVAVITSSTIISFKLIHLKVCHPSTLKHFHNSGKSLRVTSRFFPFNNDYELYFNGFNFLWFHLKSRVGSTAVSWTSSNGSWFEMCIEGKITTGMDGGDTVKAFTANL